MTTKRNALLVAGLLAGFISAGSVWAHGDVVPHAVATPGLTPIKDSGVQVDGDGWASIPSSRVLPGLLNRRVLESATQRCGEGSSQTRVGHVVTQNEHNDAQLPFKSLPIVLLAAIIYRLDSMSSLDAHI